MRGFPLLRSILILLGLSGFALGLIKLTTAKQPVTSAPPVTTIQENHSEIPYHLDLSAPAAEIAVGFGDHPAASLMAGNLNRPADATYLSIRIRWSAAPQAGERRFAKLTLDPPGKPTVTHVFDAAGDIDDILELP